MSGSEGEANGQEDAPRLHHVLLNSVDPEAAIDWYRRLWPTAGRTEVAGHPAVAAEMYLLFEEVDAPPPGGWRHDLHRAEPQSAFWHIGLFANTSGLLERLGAEGFEVLRLFTTPADSVGVVRSGLSPFAGTKTAEELAASQPEETREGGFGYLMGPDGALVEVAGGPSTTSSFNHVHLYHEEPLCAANWYAEHLGMQLPPERDEATGQTRRRPPWEPCAVQPGEPSWPSLEPVGTIRQPRGSVQFAGGSLAFYPRQCIRGRCGEDRPLTSSRGQVLDHLAFTVRDLDRWASRLRDAGVKFLHEPHPWGPTRAFMFEGPDALAIELVERQGAPIPGG